MNISKPLTITLCLILASAPILTTQSAFAGNGAISPLNAEPKITPIGKVESAGRIMINGRVASGKEAIWDGELLQIPADSNADVSLENIGQVTLKGGAVVRLATVLAKSKDRINRRALSASVVNGEVDVKLNDEAMAFVQAGRSAYLTKAGADFHVSVRDDVAKLNALNGAVMEMGSWAIRMPSMSTGRVSGSTINTGTAGNARKPGDDYSLLRAEIGGEGGNSFAERESPGDSFGLSPSSFSEESNPATRLRAKATAGMIGMAESPGDMIINGRSARGKEWIWDGEILRSPNASAQVTLNGIGKVMLSSGSEVKLSAAVTGVGGNNQRRALVASLTEGRAIFRVNPDSEAYIRSGGEAFVASGGSEFRLTSNRAGAVLGVMKGDVRSIGGWTIEMAPQMAELLVSRPSPKAKASSRKYFILPVESGYQTSVRANSARELKFKVTDEHSRPVFGLPVTFSLNSVEGEAIGSLGYGQNADNSYTVITDTEGVATAPFKAGNKPGSVSISASVEGSGDSHNNVVTVTKDKGSFWHSKDAAWVAAAAIIITGIVVVATKENRLPIKGTGPVEIIP